MPEKHEHWVRVESVAKLRRPDETRADLTAVAQLLFTLSRGNRSERQRLAISCATPICLLEQFESRKGEVFDRVVSRFQSYIEVRQKTHNEL